MAYLGPDPFQWHNCHHNGIDAKHYTTFLIFTMQVCKLIKLAVQTSLNRFKDI